MTRFVVVIDETEEFFADNGDRCTAKEALIGALDFAEMPSMVYEQTEARAQLERNAEALLNAARAAMKLVDINTSEAGRALAEAIKLCSEGVTDDSGAVHVTGSSRATT